MGLFVPEDKNYDETVRQVGFNRYKQLLGNHFGDWLKVGLLTFLGGLPLAGGIVVSILSSSILLLIPVPGIWYIVFLSMHLLYGPLNEAFQIEARIQTKSRCAHHLTFPLSYASTL